MQDFGIGARGALAVFAVVVACSTTSSGTIDNPYPNCPRAKWVAGGSPNQACTTCIATQCTTPMNQVYGATGCRPYLDCICSDSGGPACVADITPACVAATETATSCIQQHCPVDCGSFDAGALDGGGIVPGDSGSNGTLSATCQALSTCCALITTASVQANCNYQATLNNDSVCSAALGAFTDAGACP